MTINSDLSRARYVGNGVTTTFAIPFAYLTNNDGTAQVAIYVGDNDTPLVEGKDYTVKGFGKYSDDYVDEELITYETRYESGEFTLLDAPMLGQPVAVIRNVPQTQGVVFVEGEKFPAQDFENALDKLTMEVQEIKESMERAVIVPPTSVEKPIEVRDNIIQTAKDAQKTSESAIVMVTDAKETLEQGIITVEEKTQNAVDNINTVKAKAVQEINISVEENIEKSRVWAEGEQDEVNILGGNLSSMGAANLAYAITNAPEDTPIDASGLFAMNVVKGPKGDKGDKGEDGKDGSGIQIGDIGFTVFGIDETKNLRRYLDGQVISQEQFETFTNIIKERAKLYPNIIATEENWQAEVTNSKLGQCGKFVIDDDARTIRLPKVVNVQGLQDLSLMGSIKAESLPNIKGNTTIDIANFNTSGASGGNGAITQTYKANHAWAGNNRFDGTQISIDASRSSSTYQDNAPVQQEAIQYPYFIQVATGVEESVDVTREIELNNPFSLLDYKWSEYEITNSSWLLANGKFHSGLVYKSVYELLLKIYNKTETKEGVNVKLSTEEYTDFDFVLNTENTSFRLPNRTKDDFVIESKEQTNEDTSWYKIYKSGWIEQGDIFVWNGAWTTLKFHKEFANTNYHISGSGYRTDSSPYQGFVCFKDYTTTGCNIWLSDDTTSNPGHIRWFACGKSIEQPKNNTYFYVGETIQDANVINAGGVLTRVADLNDSYISGLGMPSNMYIDLTLGASGTQYTAPANGYFYIGKNVTAWQYFQIENNTKGYTIRNWSSAGTIVFIAPASKGDICKTVYNAAGGTDFFKFIYAEGDK